MPASMSLIHGKSQTLQADVHASSSLFRGIKIFNRVKQLKQQKAMWEGPGD